MPLCTLYLLSLGAQTSTIEFLSSLKSWGVKPLTIAKPIRWIITPEHIDTAQLLQPLHPYDLLLILPNTKPLPGPLEAKLSTTFKLQVGIPTRLINDFATRNKALLHPARSNIPKLTGALDDPVVDPVSSQHLTLSPELQRWIKSFATTATGQGAMSMLNLLAFKPDKKDSYLEYGRAFAESIGSKRGGDAKLVGHVVYSSPSSSGSSDSGSGSGSDNQEKSGARWDEFALAHYPSITHFADMLASKDYQDVNQRFRVPALRDTCILCTSEIEIEDLLKAEGAKL